jgi:hypothetical protein
MVVNPERVLPFPRRIEEHVPAAVIAHGAALDNVYTERAHPRDFGVEFRGAAGAMQQREDAGTVALQETGKCI